jgi:hypothetical protein
VKEILMQTQASFEKRLAAVESAVAEIQCRLERVSLTSNWLERFTGAFKDEPAFAEVVEYGRALRTGDRPLESPKP